MGEAGSHVESQHIAICGDRARRQSNCGAAGVARLHPQGRRQLEDDYILEGEINFDNDPKKKSAVAFVHRRYDHKKYALKAFNTHHMTQQELRLVVAEVETFLKVDHPNIVRLHDVYETDDHIVYVVMECCTGGELFDRLQERGRLTELEVWEATRQMLCAVSYLHAHDIVHRDLKLENFLYVTEDQPALRLIDFGLAAMWNNSTTMHAKCGTSFYVSPEMMKENGYTSKCDMWSLGVIIFVLLTGRMPVQDDKGSPEAWEKRIRRGEICWDLLNESKPSSEAVCFIEALLVLDPDERLDTTAATMHPWIVRTRECSDSLILTGDVLKSFHCYIHGPQLRRATLQLLACQMAPEEAVELTNMFLKLASDSRGTVDVNRLWGAIRRERGSGYKVPGLPPTPLQVASHERHMLDLLDTDNDGKVHYSSFLAAFLWAYTVKHEEAVRAAFSRFNDRYTGTITANSLRSSLGGQFEGVDVEELIKEVDVSGKGHVNFEAFNRLIAGDVQ